MSRYDEFIRQVESESQTEGPKAVAELKAFRDYYRTRDVTAKDAQWCPTAPE